MQFPWCLGTPFISPGLELRTLIDFPECMVIRERMLREEDHDAEGVLTVTRYAKYRDVYDYRCNFTLPDILEEEEGQSLDSVYDALVPNQVDCYDQPDVADDITRTIIALRRYANAQVIHPAVHQDAFLGHPAYALITGTVLGYLERLKGFGWKALRMLASHPEVPRLGYCED